MIVLEECPEGVIVPVKAQPVTANRLLSLFRRFQEEFRNIPKPKLLLSLAFC
jgi:hypothetical protein